MSTMVRICWASGLVNRSNMLEAILVSAWLFLTLTLFRLILRVPQFARRTVRLLAGEPCLRISVRDQVLGRHSRCPCRPGQLGISQASGFRESSFRLV